MRQTGRVLARSCAAPLSRLTPTAPLTGEPSGWQSPQSLPCKGRWMRRKAQTEGCIAGLRQKYPARPGRTLPCLRRGRCLHRPGNPAVVPGPRGGRNRPPYKAVASGQQRTNASHPPGPPGGLVPAQKDTRKARCRTPPSPGATLPVCGARIALRVLKHTCVLRPLRCREAAKTGAVSEGRSYAFYRRTGDNKRSDGRLPHEKQLSPPQAALDSAAPYRGGFIGGSPPKASPARGGGCAARRRRRGALPVCGKNILQGPAGPCPASVGDDACIVPETLRWRKAPAAGEIARPTLRP